MNDAVISLFCIQNFVCWFSKKRTVKGESGDIHITNLCLRYHVGMLLLIYQLTDYQWQFYGRIFYLFTQLPV